VAVSLTFGTVTRTNSKRNISENQFPKLGMPCFFVIKKFSVTYKHGKAPTQSWPSSSIMIEKLKKMRPENNSFQKAAKLARKEGKPEPIRHSELRGPAGSNAVQDVNSFDARGRNSANHEADGALVNSHAQRKDSSRIKPRLEITADDRANGVPTPKSGHAAHGDPKQPVTSWKKRYQQDNATIEDYKQNSDENQPSLKPSRKSIA
jgi:hypothetical protein